MKSLGIILRPASAFILVATVAGAAHAQAPAAPVIAPPPAAANPNIPAYGPPLTGVCVFSRDYALNSSQAGVSVIQQLNQMEQTAKTGLDGERQAISDADKALTADKPKLNAAKFQERATALQQRAQTYETTIQVRNDQFARTRDKAMDKIAQSVTPILVSTISAHHCSLIVERSSIYGANPAMDLTPEVLQKLNVAMPTATVTLEPPATAQR